MDKNLVFMALLSIIFCTHIEAMEQQSPLNFRLATALDNISISKICQTCNFVAGITMFYKACDVWAKSHMPFPATTQPMPDEGSRSIICQGRRRASLRYFITGCAFTAAGLLQRYGSQIIKRLPTLTSRLFAR